MIRTGRGPRATTFLLMKDLDDLLVEGRAPDLNAPVLILVPSRALKRQLSARLMEHFQGAVLGVEIQTPYNLANQILSTDPDCAEPDPGISPIVIRREAAKLKELDRLLARFHDGHGLCAGSVSDLLSAGLDDNSAEPCRARINSLENHDLRNRASDLIDLGMTLRNRLGELSLSRTSFTFERATAALGDTTRPRLSYRQVLLFGFSDAPGRTCEFLTALLGCYDSRFYLDLPPEITDAQAEAKGAVFARGFAAQLGFDEAEIDEAEAKQLLPCTWQGFSAVGTESEVRELAGRIATLIREGMPPRKIGVVVRDMNAYLPIIRSEFEALGIPFRGGSLPRGFHPMSSACGAVQSLLLDNTKLSLEHLIEIAAAGCDGILPSHLAPSILLRSRSLGLRTIEDIHTWREGRQGAQDEVSSLEFTKTLIKTEEGWSRRSLKLAASDFDHLLAVIGEVEAWSAAQNSEQGTADWAQALRHLLVTAFGWEESGRPGEILAALTTMAGDFAGVDVKVSRSEFHKLLTNLLNKVLESSATSSGTGVEVLTLEKARSLCFDALFVVGVTRGTYPRLGNEDPLLTDQLRTILAGVLPRLGRHHQRPDEESYLFAQLLEAADSITLSWQRADDDGKSCARSPFIDRLALDEGVFSVDDVPRDLNEAIIRDAALGRCVRADDAVLWANTFGNRSEQTAAKSTKLRSESPDDIAVRDCDELAQAWTDVVIELDPDLSSQDERARLKLISPWFGMVGQDSRRRRTFVTNLEKTAGCPWQAFVGKLLGFEQPPDPWRDLPELDALVLGNTVHQALEDLVDVTLPTSPLPDEEAIQDATLAAAREQLGDLNKRLPGFAPILSSIAIPFVKRAFALDWSDDLEPNVVGVETTDSVVVELEVGTKQEIFYKADRVDESGETRSITDYKTGKPLSEAKTPGTRMRHAIGKINNGTMLQGAAYAVSSGGTGRYIFLQPEIPDDTAVAELPCSDDLRQRFEAVAGRLMDAWHQGLFPPRLESGDGKANDACEYCDLKAACLHGDSSSRRRLAELAGSADSSTSVLLRDLWSLSSFVERRLEPEE